MDFNHFTHFKLRCHISFFSFHRKVILVSLRSKSHLISSFSNKSIILSLSPPNFIFPHKLSSHFAILFAISH